MNNHWYFKHNETVFGPVKYSELKTLRTSGHIKDQSPVCRKGMQDWVSFSQLMASTEIFAHRGNRFGGFVVDMLAVFLIVVLGFSFLNMTLLSGSFEQANINPMVLYMSFGLVWMLYESFYTIYKRSPTPGKKWFGVKVANVRGSSGDNLQILTRSFLKVLLLIVVDFFRLSGILGPLYFVLLAVFIPFGLRKRTVYDYATDTVCMKVRKRS